MATSRKRTSSTTSETGAYMSQYDQEVEVRLGKIEKALNKPSAPAVDGDKLAALEAKLDRVVAALKVALPGVAKGL